MDAEYVRDLIRQGRVDFIAHSELRLAQRVFDPALVLRAILGGVVVQEYPHNEPLPRMFNLLSQLINHWKLSAILMKKRKG